jgi:hypothetical protein
MVVMALKRQLARFFLPATFHFLEGTGWFKTMAVGHFSIG